jgi:PTS system ascorbate-specific IIB component
MLKVIADCGSGMVSSQIIKMKIEKVFKKLGIPVEIHHSSISEANPSPASTTLSSVPKPSKQFFFSSRKRCHHHRPEKSAR